MTKFSEDFLWGAATSAFQVEGAYLTDGKLLSTADTRSLLKSDIQADTKIASDHYNHWKEDVALMAELGLQSYRFSINWTRIYPNGDEKEPNEAGLKFYDDLITELVKNNIEPIATLYHFDFPEGLNKKYGGWNSRESINDFEKYAITCFKQYGDRVKYWITINEQNLQIFSDVLLGINEADPQKANVMRHQMNYNMFVATAKAIKACHEIVKDGKVGPAISYVPIYPASPNPEDILAAKNNHDMRNKYMMHVHCFGEYPGYYKKFLKEHEWLPEIFEEDMKLIKENTPDFIALNYYRTNVAKACSKDISMEEVERIMDETFDYHFSVVPGYWQRAKNEYLKATEYGWQIDPIGFRIALRELEEAYHLPIMITENGMGTFDVLTEDEKVHDSYRIEYLRNHIEQIRLAIEDGVKVISYNPWTMIDVLSSSNGFKKRYGFVYIDRDEFDEKECRRIKKDSFYWYQKVIKSNGENLED